MNALKSKLQPLASAAIFYYATIWLVVLVVIGTVSQKFFGLQASLETYFSAWFIQPMDMPLYLPSGRFIMAVIMVNLTAKLILATKWKAKMLGINITHLGVILLMIGGVLTAYTTTEGSLAIQEGKSSSTFKDFHQLELAVTDHSPKDHDAVTTFSDGFFTSGQPFSDSAIPLTFKVTQFYKNCKIVTRPTSERRESLKRQASRLKLLELPTDKNDRNTGGIEIEISGATPADNGTYLFYNHPQWGATTITDRNGKTYSITLRPRHYELPFTLTLRDFEKLDHAGTMMARAYSSKVTVTEDGHSEDVKIYMNHPLRRKGYTLYQSSFDQSNPSGIETSVFQVVYNKGRLMPYLAVIVITLGLLIHVLIQVPKLLASKKTPQS